jgi:hypothetical protein
MGTTLLEFTFNRDSAIGHAGRWVEPESSGFRDCLSLFDSMLWYQKNARKALS